MGKRILIADDSVTIQRAFAMVLTGQPDLTLIAARSYDEALTVARRDRPDMAIVDIALGNRSGYDLVSAFKADAGLRAMPVLLLGSGQVPYDELKGRQAGADGHLLKPFESQSLIDRLREVLTKSVSAPVPTPARAPAAPAPARQDTTSKIPDPLFEDESSYGEFTIERAPEKPRPAPVPAARPVAAPARPVVPARPAAAAPAPAAAAPAPSSPPRPSLIPGVTPQAGARVAAAAPAVRAAPLVSPLAAIDANRPGALSRTIMGMPAVGAPLPAAAPAPAAREARESRPASVVPAAPAVRAPASPAAAAALEARPEKKTDPRLEPRSEQKVDQKLDLKIDQKLEQRLEQKLSALSAKGPEYEAIVKLSREVIEQVVWEVVPELAEIIIRQEVDRLASARK